MVEISLGADFERSSEMVENLHEHTRDLPHYAPPTDLSNDFDLNSLESSITSTMAADIPTSTQTPPPSESKIARKKKAKAEAVATAEVGRKGSSTSIEHPQTKANGEEGPHENYYVKELHK